MNIGKTGGTGEYLTAEFLRKNGYTVVKRNYHCRYGEIDIIAETKEYIIMPICSKIIGKYPKSFM